ncbi:MAG TPA: hypothetical protein VFO79_10160 [Xanthomonadales bacterium]|nr:hypothetical protein [Xanthomonadales bacterium]
MIRVAVLPLVAAMACGRSSGVSDEQLGNLVVEPKTANKKIDVARAASEPAELGRAIERRYETMLAELGPHAITIKTETVVDEAGKAVSQLTDEATIENGEQGAYRAVYTNSADYGRETIFTGGKLYLRPRYQRWHGRMPENPAEPVEIRESFYGALPATWDLVGHAAELTDRGVVQIAGRSGRKIEVKLDPSHGKAPREQLAQRKWREGRSVEALSGHVVLDADNGAPLAAELAGAVAFSRDGRSFVMKLKLSSTVANVGKAATIVAPPEGEVVATPGRMREVDDRDYLLQGIAPPLRKNPDGTAVKPEPKP